PKSFTWLFHHVFHTMPWKINYKFWFPNFVFLLIPTSRIIKIITIQLNKTNEPLFPLAFDLDQLPSHNQAINSIQDMLEGFQLAHT
ncbi:hypothetical protein VP01_15045g1, partial [Puccinia sorghi]